jgi:hypothetical protein
MQPMENARILIMAQLKHRKKRPCHSAPVADYGTHYTYAKTCSERLAPCLAVSAEGFLLFSICVDGAFHSCLYWHCTREEIWRMKTLILTPCIPHKYTSTDIRNTDVAPLPTL